LHDALPICGLGPRSRLPDDGGFFGVDKLQLPELPTPATTLNEPRTLRGDKLRIYGNTRVETSETELSLHCIDLTSDTEHGQAALCSSTSSALLTILITCDCLINVIDQFETDRAFVIRLSPQFVTCAGRRRE